MPWVAEKGIRVLSSHIHNGRLVEAVNDAHSYNTIRTPAVDKGRRFLQVSMPVVGPCLMRVWAKSTCDVSPRRVRHALERLCSIGRIHRPDITAITRYRGASVGHSVSFTYPVQAWIYNLWLHQDIRDALRVCIVE